MSQSFRRKAIFAFIVVLVLSLAASTAFAQYTLKTLVKNSGKNGDKQLINPWGLAYGPSEYFWFSDEGTGLSTLYDGNGVKQSLVVTIPTATGAGVGSPTGIVYNGGSQFQIMHWTSAFMFATLDGLICGWSHFEPNNALIGVSNPGAVYTGLAINQANNQIYASDFVNNKIDVYDGTFKFIKSFTDPAIPAGYGPFNVQDIGGQLYVAYALLNGKKGGYVDIFSESGTLVKTLIHGKQLNQPWGFAMAPTNFGTFSNALLVSNNVNAGTVAAIDPNTGAFLGTLSTSAGKVIKLAGVWGIEFGGGDPQNGATNALYWVGGPKDDSQGVYGVVTAN
ncbi:MAG TPA: TIGR03118 family protein [Terriglobales bacterium]|nr:TIGR03118 family protein [Terriglobales bacterium]